MQKVLISGSIAYDRIMDFPGLFRDHFLADQLHNINLSFQVKTVAENFGGCSGNIAYSLRLLGNEPVIISVGGSDFGRYAEYLRSLGVDPMSIHLNAELPTSIAFIMTDKADNQLAAFSMGAGDTPYTPLPDTAGASCGIVSAGNPEDIRALPGHYRSVGLPYFYDPGQAILELSGEELRAGMESAEGLFGNDYEMRLVAEKTGWDEAQMLQHTKVLIVTLGEKGSRVITKDGEVRVVATPVSDAKDPTGAGDAYRAGFLAGYLHGFDAERSAKLASAVAAYAVESYGTQNHHFTMDELKERYQEAYGEELELS